MPALEDMRPRTATINGCVDGVLPKDQELAYVPHHPLIKHFLALARDQKTPTPAFRNALSELGRMLIYEAVRDCLPTAEDAVDTPVGRADVEWVDESRPIKVVPILRAGLTLVDHVSTLLPGCQVLHVGYVRDEKTLKASMYLNKFPSQFSPNDVILVCDPMLATGGTMLQCLRDLVARGANPANIRVICVVAAPVALKLVAEEFPGLKVFAAAVDEGLNAKGYIIPGLGDAGDRAYGTL